MWTTRTHGAPNEPRAMAAPQGERQIQSPWAGPGVPATATDERRFVGELEHLVGGRTAPFRRLELTVMMTAFRSGVALAELLGQAPGIDPRRLLAAYRAVEERRSLAEHAWDAIANDPTPETFDLFRVSATPLLPVLISGLVRARAEPEGFAFEVDAASDAVSQTTVRVLALETLLSDDLDVTRRIELGSMLCDGGANSAWNLPAYLPARVGTLMPVRLEALIGGTVEFPSARPRPGRAR
ncbi:MAG: hypothetical protein FD127_1009 [Acidimicrobiaceae bacterium]|nr:MAG: hypothetical protein FD127_1009 [Acidimicrobiaceae bacterium]